MIPFHLVKLVKQRNRHLQMILYVLMRMICLLLLQMMQNGHQERMLR